jgi:hypothetical protein
MTHDPRKKTVRDLDDALWSIVVPGREPEEVAAALRSWGVLNARGGAAVILREADPANITRTAGLDPLDPQGGPIAEDVLLWSLASTLRYRAGLPPEDEAQSGDKMRPVRVRQVDKDGNEVEPVKIASPSSGRPTAWSARVAEDSLAEADAEASADVGEEDIISGRYRLVPTRAYEVWSFQSMTEGSRLGGLVVPTANGWSVFTLEDDGYESPEEAAEALG